MKAIILLSSIFYILGLKFSDKIELIKRSNPVEKIVVNTIAVKEASKTVYFCDEVKSTATADTIKSEKDKKEIKIKP